MTARGIKLNWDQSGESYAGIVVTTTSRFDLLNEDFAICCWLNIRGDKPNTSTNSRGQVALWVFDTIGDGNGVVLHSLDCDNTFQHSPWTMTASCQEGAPGFATTDFANTGDNLDTNENWFLSVSWNHTAGQWTYFYVVDGGTIASSASATGLVYTTPINTIRIGSENSVTRGCNIEVTNVKVWKRAFSSVEIDSERRSEAMVITSSAWAHWKLASAADLNDYSGNARTLTLTGTVNDGTMDPVDIQTASGSGCLWYGILKA